MYLIFFILTICIYVLADFGGSWLKMSEYATGSAFKCLNYNGSLSGRCMVSPKHYPDTPQDAEAQPNYIRTIVVNFDPIDRSPANFKFNYL